MVSLADRVEQETSSTGTGTLDLGAVPSNRIGFVTGAGGGAEVPYVIEDGNGVDWEIGRGTVTSGPPDTLSRDTVVVSSAGGSLVSLSTSIPHTVFLAIDTKFLNTLMRSPPQLTQASQLLALRSADGNEFRTTDVILDINNNISGMGQVVVSDSSSYTLTKSQNGTTRMEASGITVTIPEDATENIDPGFSTSHFQDGANAVTFSPESNVTVKSKGGNLKTNGQNAPAMLFKQGPNTWVLSGDLTS